MIPVPERLSTVTIETTTHCNLRCPGCLRTDGVRRGSWESRHMAPQDFSRVIEHLPPVENLILHGLGEPTLGPHLPEFVRQAKEAGKFRTRGIFTNAVARDAAYFESLVEAGLNALTVSVDSLDPRVAERVRPGTDVSRLRAILRDLQHVSIPIWINIVVSRVNEAGVVDTLRELNEIGRFWVVLSPFQDLGVGSRGWRLSLNGAIALAARVKAMRPEWPNLRFDCLGGLVGGVHIRVKPLRLGRQAVLPVASAMPRELCRAPFLSPAVTVDGYLAPCCVCWDPAELGRIKISEVPFAEAWARPSYQSFLRRFEVRTPPFCRSCPSNSSWREPVQWIRRLRRALGGCTN